MSSISSKYIQLHVARFNPNANQYEHLVLKRASKLKLYPNIWQVITGNIENNEKAFETALRELKEETQLSCKNFFALPMTASFYVAINDVVELNPVFAILVDYIEQVHISYEHSEYKWCNLDEAIKLVSLKSHKEGIQCFYDFILSNQNAQIYEILI